MLTGAIVQAASTVHLGTPATPGLPARTLYWGCEHGIRPVTVTGDLTDSKVAAYVAKYATKATECTGTLDRRITPADRLADLPVREHARRLIAKCLRLGRLCRSRVHVVAARLGHADPAVTLRVYSHVLREHAASIGDVFARAWTLVCHARRL